NKSIGLVATLVADQTAGLVLQPGIARRTRQRVNAVYPGHLALDSELPGRRRRFRIIEAVDGDTDIARAFAGVGRWRAAILAEAALGRVRALESRRRTTGPAEVCDLAPCETHERLTGGLLAHPAIADARVGRLFQPFIAQRAALASAGQFGARCHWQQPPFVRRR